MDRTKQVEVLFETLVGIIGVEMENHYKTPAMEFVVYEGKHFLLFRIGDEGKILYSFEYRPEMHDWLQERVLAAAHRFKDQKKKGRKIIVPHHNQIKELLT